MNTVLLLKQFELKGKTVLDLGSGAGSVSLPLAELGARVTSVDKDNVAVGKFNHKNILRVCSDVREYDFIQDSFDIIVARNILPFLGKDLYLVFEKIVRAIKSRGVLFCTFFGERDEWRNKENIKCLTEAETINLVKKYNLRTHYREAEEGLAPTMAGPVKYWHVLSYLLIKD